MLSIIMRTFISAFVPSMWTRSVAARISSRISSRIAWEGKRMPMLILASPGTVFSPIPPLTMPQLINFPRSISRLASSSRTL